MDWWREVSKTCLNFAVLTVATFVYTTLTGRWNVVQCIFGIVTAGAWIVLSHLFWRKGGK